MRVFTSYFFVTLIHGNNDEIRKSNDRREGASCCTQNKSLQSLKIEILLLGDMEYHK